MKRILVTGGTGQLGMELLRQPWRPDIELWAPGRAELDLADQDAIRAAIADKRPDCVINAAAYTAVDIAEDDASNAFLANCQGPVWLAEETAKAAIPLLHVSTDYVFRGDGSEPYGEEDPVNPIGVYGASKAAGELAVRSINARSVIVRTAWVLSAYRSNFLKTMLRLAADRPKLRVVSDQIGCPTSAADLASAIVKIALRQIDDPSAPVGTYHFVNGGEASWYDLAVEIFRLSKLNGGPAADVDPISTSEFPTRARRPANSRLATDKISRDYSIRPREWRAAVADIITELDRAGTLKELVR